MAQREIVRQRILTGYSRISLLFLISTIALQFPTITKAADNPVVLVNQASLSYHKKFIVKFKEILRKSLPRKKVTNIDIDDTNLNKQFTDILPTASVIVTIGSKAAGLVTQFETEIPTLHSLITSRSSKQLHRSSACAHNILYLEQPVERLLGSIAIALPSYKNTGILLTENTRHLDSQIKETAEKYSFKVTSLMLTEKEQLNGILENIFSTSEVLLTLPDPLIINSRSARVVLEGAYLHQIPIISYSNSMVKAGALLAVYSTPQQIGAESAQIVMKMLKQGCTRKGSAMYPNNYSIAVNYQVARALGLDIQKEAVLLDKLKRLMATQ